MSAATLVAAIERQSDPIMSAAADLARAKAMRDRGEDGEMRIALAWAQASIKAALSAPLPGRVRS